jgi:SAM-dependent methyltransferase
MPHFDLAEIRRYYDRHTPSFIRFGQGGHAGAIHRAVWGPGITTRLQALHYVDDQIAELARSLRCLPERLDGVPRCLPERLNGVPSDASAMPHLVDLGCGVGASLCYLAERLPIRGTGITVSPVQVRLAAERIRDARLSDRVTCIEGDYCDIPPSVGRADLAYAIESFVHGPAPRPVLAECARLIRPGGLLVICDDFRRSTDNAAAARAIDRFRRGWRINTLLSRDELRGLAQTAGFEHQSTVDLSSALEIRRARDRVITLLGVVADWLPLGSDRLDYLLGGSALQECLAHGWIGYDLTAFRRLDEVET